MGDGNDTFIAVKTGGGGDSNTDNVDGGKGTDTYDASDATTTVSLNLDTIQHFSFAKITATGTDVGPDTIAHFENAIGGSAADDLYGSGGANALSGGVGADTIAGLGGTRHSHG